MAAARRSPFIPIAVAALLAAAIGIALAAGGGGSGARNRQLGLFTSLPILWAESEDVAGMLRSDIAPHWAKSALQAHGRIVPLDSLADGKPLAGLPLLVMAQPRPLSPGENVALDDWVRGGGRLLLFADPALTGESRFAIGDRRRPQDLAMLSPILSRWGLQLEFDDGQPAGEHDVTLLGEPLPVNLPGQLSLQGTQRNCRLLGQGLAALCSIGSGRVLVLADAALLESTGAKQDGPRAAALDRLLAALGVAQ